MGTGSHLGLSFSELGVLMSTPSSEKDSLLRLPVPVKIAPKFLKKEVFIVTPFKCFDIQRVFISLDIYIYIYFVATFTYDNDNKLK